MSEEEFVEYEDVVQDAVEGILARLWWIHNTRPPWSRASTRSNKFSNTGLLTTWLSTKSANNFDKYFIGP